MRISEFVKLLERAFDCIGSKYDSHEIKKDIDIEDSFDIHFWGAMTGKKGITAMYISTKEHQNVAVIYMSEYGFDRVVVALAHIGWFKSLVKHWSSFSFDVYLGYVMKGSIDASIRYNDPIALTNLLEFDIEGFVADYNRHLEPCEFDNELFILPSEMGHYKMGCYKHIPKEDGWIGFTRYMFDEWLDECNKNESNECKAVLLRWSKEHMSGKGEMEL